MNSRQQRKKAHTQLKEDRKTVCPECGERGRHWVEGSWRDYGFWTCAKFYDPVTKRRIEK
jgi:hypothetical protein